MNTQRKLPGWMFAEDATKGDIQNKPAGDLSSSYSSHPLIHLLPRLKEYLSIVDPDRVDRAMEVLINCQSDQELFADLQTQYGDVPIESTDRSTSGDAVASDAKPARKRSQSPKSTHGRTKSKVQRKAMADEDDLSDFIVSDSDVEEDSKLDEGEESEFSESESEIEEPEPEDLSRRKISPHSKAFPPSPPPPRAPMSTRPPDGPTALCKYGKACYRKNPIHFKEFAHPWLLNQPGDV